MRFAQALVCFAAALTGCTTSTAVLTWHDAWKAEQAGDLDKAERGYATAAELNPGLVGAECNRIRLIAAHPDRSATAQAALDKLLNTKAALPEVATIAAFAALQDGKIDVGRKRLDAARKLTEKDPPDVQAARRVAELRLLAAEGHFAEAWAASRAVDLAGLTTADRHLRAVIAWNGNHVEDAAQTAPQGSEVSVWAAVARQDHQKVVASSLFLDRNSASAAVLAMVGWSRAVLGDRTEAQTWLAQAQTRDPADATVHQVSAALALATGEPTQARDTLAALVARSPAISWSVWFDLGIAQLRLGDAPAAQQSFGRAAALCPSCSSAVRNRDALAQLVGSGP